MRITLLFILINSLLHMTTYSQNTRFEESGGTETATYSEIINFYKSVAAGHEQASLINAGMSDAGKPIHVLVLNNSEIEDLNDVSAFNKPVVFINNGIHPGEPCGIDASMLYVKNLLASEDAKLVLNDVVICIIPVYNIGGCLNRNSTTRANQIGPMEYGFRGNAKHLDLNRDFIKCDSKNAKTFSKIISAINPHIFIDTHTTNGADYQSTMTLISTQKDKLHPLLASHLTSKLEPYLYESMNGTQHKMCPYVNHGGKGPKNGITGFLDIARYSSGYTALFNTIGFITEAHMLKPYADRVLSTYQFIELITLYAQNNAQELVKLKQQANEETKTQTDFALQWELNKDENQEIAFDGYEKDIAISNITGDEVTVYNKEKPYTENISFYNNYHITKTVKRPYAYVIPSAWTNVIERLKLNNVAIQVIKEDLEIDLPVNYLHHYETLDWPFEGHYLHHSTSITPKNMNVKLYAGDYLIICNQIQNKYILQTLEPEGPDSFFNWNFFDSILMQKEYFSDYLFDATAEKILSENAELKAELEALKQNDQNFADNAGAQLDFIYKRSEHYEKNHLRYPIIRLEKEVEGLKF
ncbi:MAG: hypothetical protein KJO64_07985 [Bacteroidia bacterium]|nr:hypothetical protein [Bacteroidia bacterium]